jgi:hypothetical protein
MGILVVPAVLGVTDKSVGALAAGAAPPKGESPGKMKMTATTAIATATAMPVVVVFIREVIEIR